MKHSYTKFLSVDGELHLRELLDFLEEDLLNYEFVPDGCAKFVADIFNDPQISQQPDLWRLLHFFESENLAKAQSEAISEVLFKNFLTYQHYMLCETACEFMRKSLSPEAALKKYEAMASYELDDLHQRAMLVNLSGLLNKGELDADGKKRAQRLADLIKSKKTNT